MEGPEPVAGEAGVPTFEGSRRHKTLLGSYRVEVPRDTSADITPYPGPCRVTTPTFSRTVVLGSYPVRRVAPPGVPAGYILMFPLGWPRVRANSPSAKHFVTVMLGEGLLAGAPGRGVGATMWNIDLPGTNSTGLSESVRTTAGQ